MLRGFRGLWGLRGCLGGLVCLGCRAEDLGNHNLAIGYQRAEPLTLLVLGILILK